jgi:dienelactone hydrolase
MKKIGLYIVVFIYTFTLQAQVKVTTRSVEYKHGDVVLKGMLSYDPLLKSIRPGILVIPDQWGLSPFIIERAEEFAKLGYIVFAADMYGDSLVVKDKKKAKKLTEPFYEDRLLMRQRAAAALEILMQSNKMDKTKVAAVGYGFGGTVVLEMARGGTEVRGVISLYGRLDTPNPANVLNIKSSILVMQGADDLNINQESLENFQEEMKQAGADWQVYIYGNAVSSFSDTKAGDDKSTGIAYNYWADKRSWEALKSFLLLLLQ